MSVLHIFLFLSLLYHHGLLASANATPVRVSTKQGIVIGQEQQVIDNYNGRPKIVYKFLGIPYAKTPTGNLRFKRPQPLNTRRPNDYDATYYRPICVQTLFYLKSIKLAWPEFDSSTDMSEDCLYLNIYTPRTKSVSEQTCRKKYPVMVHIHGGSYLDGTPIRDTSPGEYLPRRDVVLVTIQYRLDGLGFFTTGDSQAPGNLGLLDQIEALKWIQNNIEGFCGDKKKVTLLGESAGGSSVSLHYLSPLSRGLFHRGIAVSGVALTFFAFKPKSTVLKGSKTLIKKLGCEKQTSQLILQCLQSKPANDIIKYNTDRFNVQPFVDHYYLPDEPRKLLKEGRFHKLPLMSGFVSNEGTNGLSKPDITNIPDYKNYLEQQFFEPFMHFTKTEATNAFDALAFQYTPWGDLESSQAYQKNIIDMRSDYFVNAATLEVLSFHSDHGAPTFMFEFAHRSVHHPEPSWKGVVHEDTTAYKFGLPLLKVPAPKTDLTFDRDDILVSFRMIHLFTNFAKIGRPGHVSIGGGRQVQWTAFDTSNKSYLKIQKTPAMTMATKYHPRRMAFWNRYFPTLFPCSERKSWQGRCKKTEAPRPFGSPKNESNPDTLAREGPKLENVRW